jgi:hypothetical protein
LTTKLSTKKGKENGSSDGFSRMFPETEPEEAIVNTLTGEAEKVGTIPSSELPGNTESKPSREDESETVCRD